MVDRMSGSLEYFDAEWRLALAGEDERYLIYPTLDSPKQFDTFEWIKAQQILEILSQQGISGGDVLEYGCGSAGISLFLAERGFHPHICDLSSTALQVAFRNRQRHAPDSHFASTSVADAIHLPYPSDHFNIVMSFGLLEHFGESQLAELLAETIRVLKPGGLFIADIAPGLRVNNVRTLGVWLSFSASWVVHLCKGNLKKLRSLRTDYLDHYFESDYNERGWIHILQRYPLKDVQVMVCRPFPPLALSGRFEAAYTRLIQRLISWHKKFDRAQNRFTRRWGWIYLVVGKKADAS